MMATVDPVILQLKADIDDYQRDLTKAQRHSDSKLDAIEKKGVAMGQSLKKSFSLAKVAAVAFAGSLVVDKVVQAITAGLEYASSLGEVAQQLGVTTAALQEYRYAGSQAGLATEETDQALSQLTRRIGEAASGTKAQAEAFDKLGVSVKDANGNIIDAGTAIPMIADALKGIESPAQRAVILMDLFGRAGQKLEPLLAGGAAGINGLRDAAHRLGIVLSEEQIQKAGDTAGKLAALKQVLEARIAGAVADNANSILALANAMMALVNAAGQAAQAFTRFKLAQGQVEAGINADLYGMSPFASDQAKAAKYRAQQDQFKMARSNLDRPGGKMGGGGPGSIFDKKGAKSGPALGGVGAVAGKGAKSASTGSGGRSGPSAEEINSRFNDELAGLARQAISAMQSVARSANERAELELRNVEFARIATETDIRANQDYSKAQKQRLLQQVAALAELERERVEFDRQRQLEQEAQQLSEEQFRAQTDALRIQYDLADSQTERKRLALEILAAEQEHLKSILDAVIASKTAGDADKQRAQVALDALAAVSSGQRKQTSQDNETPAQRYLRDLNKSSAAINEAIDDIKIDGLEALNDGLVDAIMGAKSLGDVFKNVANQIIADLLRIAIQKAIIQPLADALFGGGGGSGGGLGGLLGGLFGRASGGYVAPGQTYRVNEGASPGRTEAFMSRDGGTIIPLGKMNALTSGGQQGGGIATVRLELSGDIDARIQNISGGVAVEVVRAAAPQIIDASARETLSRAGRPRL